MLASKAAVARHPLLMHHLRYRALRAEVALAVEAAVHRRCWMAWPLVVAAVEAAEGLHCSIGELRVEGAAVGGDRHCCLHAAVAAPTAC